MRRNRAIRLLAVMLFMALAASGSFAIDGQIDVLPDGATTYVISDPGSYVLVDNVTMTQDVSCIQITAANVSLDLNGHTISGTGAGATASGIDASTSAMSTIRNGKIGSFGKDGIVIANFASLRDLLVTQNGRDGINAGNNANIVAVQTYANARWGIVVGSTSIIEGSSALVNNSGGDAGGILANGASTVRNCVSTSNAPTVGGTKSATGISAGPRSMIISNEVYFNGGSGGSTGVGIQADYGCTIQDNSSHDNFSPSATSGATAVGISAGQKCRIIGNHCTENAMPGAISGSRGFGIVALDHCTIRENFCTNNQGIGGTLSVGIQVASYCRVELNHCTNQHFATSNYGILVLGSRNTIVKNSTANNGNAGIRLGASGNWCGDNTLGDSPGLSDIGGNTLGVGDRSNITF